MSADLRLGRWQDVLADVQCDALIFDPPYSDRTHKGQRSLKTSSWMGDTGLSSITYGSVSRYQIAEIVTSWAPRTKRWIVMFGDHKTVRWALKALDAVGWYTFHPIPWVKADAGPRICGDGPSPQSEQIAIARPKRRMVSPELRFRRGFYENLTNRGSFVGSKPEDLMRAIVRDYSEPGDLICDPFAGSGTTLVSALMEGRRAVGAEMDPKHYEIARKRLAKGFTPPLFVDRPEPAKQAALFGDGKGE